MVTAVPRRMTCRILARNRLLETLEKCTYQSIFPGHMLYSIIFSCPDFLNSYVCSGEIGKRSYYIENCHAGTVTQKLSKYIKNKINIKTFRLAPHLINF